MEVMSKLTSMRVELGLEKSEQLEFLEEEIPAKFILPPTRMETRLIIKSLEAACSILWMRIGK
jgi:hypothetical protein